MAGYDVNSLYVGGIVKTLRTAGRYDAVFAAADAAVKATMQNPGAQRWWPGIIHENMYVAIQKTQGDQVVEKTALDTLRNTLGPIVMPLVMVTLALVGTTPGSLLSKANQFISNSVRGITLTWVSEGKNTGLFEARYPNEVPPAYVFLWRGTMSYVFELTKALGSVGEAALLPDRHGVSLRISWK